MQSDPDCPVCDGRQWEVIGSRGYSLKTMPRLSDYCGKRYRVLFEIWFPVQTTVQIESRLCCACGFVCYAPRPTSEDLDRKYRFLTSLGPDADAPSVNAPVEKARAEELFRSVMRAVKFKAGRVLDFGAGRLMSAFLARGWKCFALDYTPAQIPGVQRLGSTLDDLPPGATFDVVVCSHVLEHVADPLAVGQRLRPHLSGRGVLYVEVPMEIWRRAPLHEEPVTHVNFFTVDSLGFLLRRAGYRVHRCRMGSHLHSTGRRLTVVRACATPATQASQLKPHPRAPKRTRRLLAPDWGMRLRMAVIHPERVWDLLRRRWLRR